MKHVAFWKIRQVRGLLQSDNDDDVNYTPQP